MGEPSSTLTDFISLMGGDRQLRVEENLGAGFVRLRVAEAERRQAKHDIRCVEDIVIELLRNARDAGARHIYLATSREGDTRTLTMLDDGSGIPADMQERIFDARVTSKLESMLMDRWGVHGRGMALYSVRENARSARVVCSDPGKGTSLQVLASVSSLPERADQSSWPSVGIDDDGAPSAVRGPHNIIRSCCEFALEERSSCEVYLGSPAEVVATARRRSRPSVSGVRLLVLDDLAGLPVLERMGAAVDAAELAQVAASLGLSISERTAHRIVSGQIRPLRSVYARLMGGDPSGPSGEVDLMRDRRGLKVSDTDAAEFSRIMGRAFSYLADRYYLTLTADPTLRVMRGRITVTFEVGEQD